MQLTEEQFNEIQDLFPKPRGNVRWGHRRVLNGILYILKHGCPWRSLPACYGRWNTVYVQMRRWAERGVLAAVFERLRDRGLVASDTGIAMLDSTSVKVHLLALDDRRAWSFSLSTGGIGTMLRRVAGCSSRAV